MKKIDLRKTYYCVLDTEATTIKSDIEKVDPFNMLVYNIGYRIIDKKGKCYLEREYVVDEIFFGEYDLMRNAYYFNKLPFYYQGLADKTIETLPLLEIKKQLTKDLKQFNCNKVSAHNARFDWGALKNTMQWLGVEKPYFLPYGVEWWDTLAMARDIMKNKKTYCYYTARGNKSLTAENLYRYITLNHDFIEDHTALSDCRIESEILTYCLRQHKKMRKQLFTK